MLKTGNKIIYNRLNFSVYLIVQSVKLTALFASEWMIEKKNDKKIDKINKNFNRECCNN